MADEVSVLNDAPAPPLAAPLPGPETRVPVKFTDGSTGTVLSSDVDAMVQARQGTPIDTAAEHAHEQYGGLAGQAAAFGYGAMGTATLGASDYLAGKAGLSEGIRALQEENPIATTIGKTAGFFTPGGLYGKVGGATAKATGLALKAAGLAPEVLGAFGRVAAKAGISAAAASAEGVLAGGADTLSEASLGDPDHVGEYMAAHAGENIEHSARNFGLFGAAGGALGAVASEAFPSLRKLLTPTAADEAVGRQAEEHGARESMPHGEAPGHAPAESPSANVIDTEPALKPSSPAVDGLTGADGHMPGEVGGTLDVLKGAADAGDLPAAAESHFQRAYRDALNKTDYAQKIDDLAVKTSDAINKPIREADEAIRDAIGKSKPETLYKVADRALINEQISTSSQLATEMQKTIDMIPETAGMKSAVRKTNLILDQFSRSVSEAAKTGDSPELARLFDRLKRNISEGAHFGKNIAGSPDTADAIRSYEEMYNMLRAHLENHEIWGSRFAEGQKAINEPITRMLGSSEQFNEALMRKGETVAGRPTRDVDTNKLKNYLDQKAGAATHDADRYIGNHIQAKLDAITALETHGDLDQKTMQRLISGRRAIENLKSTIGGARSEAKAMADFDRARLMEEHAHIPHSIGQAIRAFSSPIAAAETLGSIAHTMKSGVEKLHAAVESMAKHMRTGPAPEPMKPADAVAAARSVTTLASNPAALRDRFAESSVQGSRHAPAVAASMGGLALRAVMYLAGRAPKNVAQVDPLGVSNEPPRYAPGKLESFARSYQTGTNPIGTVEKAMKDGTLSTDHVDTLKTIYPNIYAQLQELVLTELQNRKTPLSYSDRVMLGTLLSVPSDPSLRPDFVKAVQGARAQITPPSQSGPSPKSTGRKADKPMDVSVYQTAGGLIK